MFNRAFSLIVLGAFLLVVVSCGSYEAADHDSRITTVSARLIFPGLNDSGVQPLQAVNLAAPDPSVEVSEVRIEALQGASVAASGRFPFSDHQGSLVLPGGGTYSVLIDGLDIYGDVVFFTRQPDRSISGGVDNDLGTIVMTPARPLLFFPGDDGINGQELWYFDAGSWNAYMVTDINGISSGSVANKELVVYAGELFFMADDGLSGEEPWSFDGSVAGMVEDVVPGSSSADLISGAVYDNKLYITSGLVDGLWSVDSTGAVSQAGSVNVAAGGTGLAVYDGDLYFAAESAGTLTGRELWVYDSTAGAATMVRNINPGEGSSDPEDMTPYHGKLFFTATDGVSGRSLWVHDGITEPVMVPGLGNVGDLQVCDDKLYFGADDGSRGRELWAYDALANAYTLVVDIVGGSGSSNPEGPMTVLDGKLYFKAESDSEVELWLLDCEESLVQRVNINPFGSSNPGPLRGHEGMLYFGADDGGGRRLWYYDPFEDVFGDIMEPGPGVPSVPDGRGLIQFDPYRPPAADLNGQVFTAFQTFETDDCGGRAGSVDTWNFDIQQHGSGLLMHSGVGSLNGFFTDDNLHFNERGNVGIYYNLDMNLFWNDGPTTPMIGDFSFTAYLDTSDNPAVLCSSYSTVVVQRGDWYEADNQASRAETLYPEIYQKHWIMPAGDTDWVRFQGTSGSDYSLQTLGSLDTYLELREADMTSVIATAHTGGSGQNASIYWTCPTDGVYYLMVRENGGSGTGPYVLSLVSGDTFEIDDLYSQANSIDNGDTQDHTFDPSGDVDWMYLEAVGNSRYTVQTSGTTDTYLVIFDTNGSDVLRSDDNGSGDGHNARILNFNPGATGTYYIRASHASGTGTGTYAISVSGGDPYESDDTPAGAFSINATEEGGQPRSLDPAGDLDYVYFNCVETSTYTFYAGGPSEPDAFMTIYANNGSTPVASDDNSGDGYKNPQIQWTCPDSAVYHLRMEAADGTQTGAYWLYAVGGDPFEPDNSSATASTLLEGSANAQDHTLDPPPGYTRHSDWVKFSATSGYDYILETSGPTDTFLTLYDVDGTTPLATDDNGAGAGSNASITWSCATSGVYYGEIKGATGSVVGPYSVSVVEDSGGAIIEW